MFDSIDDKTKEKLLKCWKSMSESDKMHFINQVAISLSVWGDDQEGKKLIIKVLQMLAENGSNTLADFGLYVENLLDADIPEQKKPKIKRAALILEGYRFKEGLPSIPHRDITL
jgi:uncharacterized protein HemY